MEKVMLILKYSVCIVILTSIIFAILGWKGIVIFLGVVMALAIACVVFLGIMIYGFGRSFAYTEKEIGKEIKEFLGYDFGKEYEVLVNETRVHGDRPVHFLIKIPQDAMRRVEDFCRAKRPSKCTSETCEKDKEYKNGNYVERHEHMTINFKNCTIEFSGVSF